MKVITLEVGSWGILNLQGFKALFSMTEKISPQRHVEPFKDSLQSSYTPVTKNLDCKKPYNLANMTKTGQEQQRQA